ncbi:sulfurtransferase [Gordonia rubripertincta]|uniref:Sulfurtransferase n=1 Tax=Gordonia rubripertincta TaxID=36822 RepID=A0ABT4N2L4_GORRU|nr:sulfurtransferase [Gordonia rubripertincta]MCZ4553497.1 sulfurtransferase [Gordonia rubripertincta]
MSLISVPELAAELEGPRGGLRLLDVRWSLSVPDGREAFESGHIRSAVYVDLETQLSDHSVSGRGRHPLPEGTALQAALRRWGVNRGDSVVVYDDWNRAGSSRAWWVLRAAGIADVRILDGGLGAWVAAGHSLAVGSETPATGDVELATTDLYSGQLPTLTAEQVLNFAGVLVDARAPERYRGEIEPIDPVAGHVPGAVNAPSTATLDEHGFFRNPSELREFFAAAGVTGSVPVGVYCGSGVTAAVDLVALELAGIGGTLFPGSWSQWSSDPANPIATGPDA